MATKMHFVRLLALLLVIVMLAVVPSRIVLAGSNTPPQIAGEDPIAVTMDEDGMAASLNLSAVDPDVADTLTWSMVVGAEASHGVASITGNDTGMDVTIAYLPTANYHGDDSFQVQVSDGTDLDIVTVNVTVNPRNDTPVNTAYPEIIGTPHATNILTAGNGDWNDDVDRLADPEYTPQITFGYQWQRATSSGGAGLQDISGASAQTYVPTDFDNNYFVRVKVTATDAGNGQPASQSTSAVSAFVQIKNAAPVITEGDMLSQSVNEEAPLNFSLSATDSDNDSLIWSISSNGSKGSASINDQNGDVTYHPTGDATGSDTFKVRVSDGHAGVDTITINVTINPVNDKPVNVTSPVISGNFLVGASVSSTTGSWDDSKDQASPTFIYEYQWQRADDGNGLNLADISGATAASYLIVNADNSKYLRACVVATDNGVPTPGVASDRVCSLFTKVNNRVPTITQGSTLQISVVEDTQFSFDLSAQDSDGDALTWSISTTAGHGTAAVIGSGNSSSVTYQPALNSNSNDTFTVQVNDGHAGTATIRFNVTITSVNDAPTLTAVTPFNAVAENTPFTITYAALAAAADEADVETSPLSFRIESVFTGTLTKNGSPVSQESTIVSVGDTLVWTPTANTHGILNAFSIIAWDGALASSRPVQVTVQVPHVNNAPVLSSIENLTGAYEDMPFAFTYWTLRGAVTDLADVDGDATSFRIETLLSGTLTKNGADVTPGSVVGVMDKLVWKPATNVSGTTAAFTIVAWDGNLSSINPVTVQVEVEAVNDPPTIFYMESGVNASEIREGERFAFDIYAEDVDQPAGDALSFSKYVPMGVACVVSANNINRYHCEWIPTEVQGGSTYLMYFKFTDASNSSDYQILQPVVKETVFQDDFSLVNKKWALVTVKGGTQFWDNAGTLHLRMTKADQNMFSISPVVQKTLTASYTAQAEFQVSSDPKADPGTVYGLVFDYLSSSKLYRFYVIPEIGYWKVQYYKSGWQLLAEGTNRTAIHATGTNLLSVDRYGNSLDPTNYGKIIVYANYNKLWDGISTIYVKGRPGVMVRARIDLPLDNTLYSEAQIDNFMTDTLR